MPTKILNPADATEIPLPDPSPAAPLTNVGITLLQARTEVVAMLKGRGDIEPERVDFWLNRAYIDLATSAKFDELKASIGFNMEANQDLYMLPEISVTTLSLTPGDEDDNFDPLRKIDQSAYRRRKVKSGFPTEYFRSNRLIVLYPTPDSISSMVLDFRFVPEPLVEDTDSPILRSDWHEAWISLSHKKLLNAVAEYEAELATGNSLATHLRMRQDPEANEDENRVVRSSAPRTEREFTRRGVRGSSILDYLRD
jgi:hypothetical protein